MNTELPPEALLTAVQSSMGSDALLLLLYVVLALFFSFLCSVVGAEWVLIRRADWRLTRLWERIMS